MQEAEEILVQIFNRETRVEEVPLILSLLGFEINEVWVFPIDFWNLKWFGEATKKNNWQVLGTNSSSEALWDIYENHQNMLVCLQASFCDYTSCCHLSCPASSDVRFLVPWWECEEEQVQATSIIRALCISSLSEKRAVFPAVWVLVAKY